MPDSPNGPIGMVVGYLLDATENPGNMAALLTGVRNSLQQLPNPSYRAFFRQKLKDIGEAQSSPARLKKVGDEIMAWLDLNTRALALNDGRKVILVDVASSGKWRTGTDGTKYRVGFDGKDGSYRVERLRFIPGGGHYHEIQKASGDGKLVSIHTADNNKRRR